MKVLCKHHDWQAKISLRQVRPQAGGQINPCSTGNIGLFLGTGLRQLEKECSMLRWCCTI